MTATTGPVPFSTNISPYPFTDAFAIAPSDSANFNSMCRAIYVGGNGNIAVVMASGNVVTLTSCLVGTILHVCAQRVNFTNTTASNLVGLI